jgi:hypothetical protein
MMARVHLVWTNATPICETLRRFAVSHSLAVRANVEGEEVHDVIMSVPQARYEDVIDDLMRHTLSIWQQRVTGRLSLLPNADVVCEDTFQREAISGFLPAVVMLPPELDWWEVDGNPQTVTAAGSASR